MNTLLAFGASVVSDQRILTVRGELDLATSARFERVLVAMVAATPPGGELDVDLRGVRFFGVAGLRALLSAASAAHAARVPFRLVASPIVGRVFEVLGIETAPASVCSTAAATHPYSWVTIPPSAGTHVRLSRSYELETLPAHPTRRTGASARCWAQYVGGHRAAGIVAEHEGISPEQALERMRARATRDGIPLATLARQIVEHRGWPPLGTAADERLSEEAVHKNQPQCSSRDNVANQ